MGKKSTYKTIKVVVITAGLLTAAYFGYRYFTKPKDESPATDNGGGGGGGGSDTRLMSVPSGKTEKKVVQQSLVSQGKPDLTKYGKLAASQGKAIPKKPKLQKA
jgi:hypothetical protein